MQTSTRISPSFSPMKRKHSTRVKTTNVNFRVSDSLKSQCERELKRRKDMDGRLTTFLNDCMRQFIIQNRTSETEPVFPLEFVSKPKIAEASEDSGKKK